LFLIQDGSVSMNVPWPIEQLMQARDSGTHNIIFK